MKPLGTITKPFPFLGQEVTTVLESLMASAHNYANFLDRLLAYVLENESPPMLVRYAVVQHSDTGKGFHFLKPIIEKYQDLEIIQPSVLRYKMSLNEATISDVLQSAERILLNSQNPWICYQMQGVRYICARTQSFGSTLEEDALTQMQNLIDEHPEMKCFESGVLVSRYDRLEREGRIAEALEHLERATTQAQLCDDLLRVFLSHINLAHSLRNLDSKRGLETLAKAVEIGNELGYDIEDSWGFQAIKASLHNVRGEYDLSLQCYEESIRIRESQTVELRALPINMSYIYSELEDGENALEWAKMGMMQPEFLSHESYLMAATLSRLARAFVLLGDLEQAERYLEESETIALKMGSDSAVAENQIVAGHIESTKGNLEAAMFHFERGLEIAEQINYQNRINSCLVGLVRTEIAMLESDESISIRDTSGPWMKLLQSEIDRKEIPGIRGRFLLLKTELRLKQGRYEEADSLLEEIRSLAENPGLKYLGLKSIELQSKIELASGRIGKKE